MKTTIQGPLPDHGRNVMRRAGYGEKPGFKGQMSYTRRVHNAAFPRFHAYLDEEGGNLSINIHLDQKEHTHGGSRAHQGEYEGPLLEQETARLKAFVESLTDAQTQRPEGPTASQKKSSFWSSLFS